MGITPMPRLRWRVAWRGQLEFVEAASVGGQSYLSEVLIVPKLVLSLPPTPWTAAIIARAMPAAMRPYSMAVAPDSSLINLRIVFMGRTIANRN
jgi:hypothetical protein